MHAHAHARTHTLPHLAGKRTVKQLLLTCQRISTEVVVCGVTERILGASSGAGVDKQRTGEEEEGEMG